MTFHQLRYIKNLFTTFPKGKRSFKNLKYIFFKLDSLKYSKCQAK